MKKVTDMGKANEAIEILKALGLPKAQQNERSGLTLLALLDLEENNGWAASKQRTVRIHDILEFIQNTYGKHYAENTRETIRRQTLHQFEQAGIVVRNPDDPERPTNSPHTVYAVESDVLKVIKKYGTSGWNTALEEWTKRKGKLIDRYEKRCKKHLVSIDLPGGLSLALSPGKHNELQAQVITDFRMRFCSETSVLYVGDTARKLLHIDENLLKELKIPITEHDKLPDVILFDRKKHLLFLIEAVTAHGPLSPKRQIELEQTLKYCDARRVYVSAFPDFSEFKKHIGDIAWDTEVWISDNPDHMIHFNGPKFFTVYGDTREG
jgi:hypothetical protein